MICPKCGKTYGNKITYCISCGVPLKEEDGIPEESINEQETKPITVSPPLLTADDTLAGSAVSLPRSISMTSRTDKAGCRKNGGEFFRITASALLSTVLFVVMILFFGSAVGRAITDESNAAQAVRSMDLLSIPAKELMLPAVGSEDFSDDCTVGEAIAAMAEGSGVDESNIRRIYERSTVKEFIGSTAAEYAAYIRDGKKPEEVTPERVKSLLGENISVISLNTGYELSESDIELAYDQIELSRDALERLSAANLERGTSGRLLKAIRAYLSAPIIFSELLAVIAAAAAIAVINKNKQRSMEFCGVPILLAGFSAALFTFMFSMQLGFFGGLHGLMKETASGISAAVSDNAYRISAVMIFLGICLLIAARSSKQTAAPSP